MYEGHGLLRCRMLASYGCDTCLYLSFLLLVCLAIRNKVRLVAYTTSLKCDSNESSKPHTCGKILNKNSSFRKTLRRDLANQKMVR